MRRTDLEGVDLTESRKHLAVLRAMTPMEKFREIDAFGVRHD